MNRTTLLVTAILLFIVILLVEFAIIRLLVGVVVPHVDPYALDAMSVLILLILNALGGR